MKKMFLIIIFLAIVININIDEEVTLPEDTIRFRIIANSDSVEDQELKMQIVNDLSQNYFPLINNTDINSSRLNIETNMQLLESRVSKYTDNYSINYGQNYFPSKEFLGTTYNAGKYESVVVSLGKSEGNNFWCVLFPPLCLLEGTNNNTSDIEYRSLVKDILDKI
ncbi:MAG: stage II sporulation protein R [Bacilli bacterium]